MIDFENCLFACGYRYRCPVVVHHYGILSGSCIIDTVHSASVFRIYLHILKLNGRVVHQHDVDQLIIGEGNGHILTDLELIHRRVLDGCRSASVLDERFISDDKALFDLEIRSVRHGQNSALSGRKLKGQLAVLKAVCIIIIVTAVGDGSGIGKRHGIARVTADRICDCDIPCLSDIAEFNTAVVFRYRGNLRGSAGDRSAVIDGICRVIDRLTASADHLSDFLFFHGKFRAFRNCQVNAFGGAVFAQREFDLRPSVFVGPDRFVSLMHHEICGGAAVAVFQRHMIGKCFFF